MAYFDIKQSFDTRVAASAPIPAFEDSEWRVILMAETDALSSLKEPGPVRRLLARLFGTPTVRRLANPRLEALRRLSVLAWHYSYALPVSAISTFLNAGFSEAQFEYALASITRIRERAAGRRSS